MNIYDTNGDERDYVTCSAFTEETFWIDTCDRGKANRSTRITYEDFDKFVAYVNEERGQYQKADITVKDLNELRAENQRLRLPSQCWTGFSYVYK